MAEEKLYHELMHHTAQLADIREAINAVEKAVINLTGEDVKTIRKNSGLTQEKFGEALGLSKSGISNIENGERGVSDTIEKLIGLLFVEANIDLSIIPTARLLEEIERRCVK